MSKVIFFFFFCGWFAAFSTSNLNASVISAHLDRFRMCAVFALLHWVSAFGCAVTAVWAANQTSLIIWIRWCFPHLLRHHSSHRCDCQWLANRRRIQTKIRHCNFRSHYFVEAYSVRTCFGPNIIVRCTSSLATRPIIICILASISEIRFVQIIRIYSTIDGYNAS